MKNKKLFKSHYLSISYKILITNNIVHYIFSILESVFMLNKLLEIYLNDFKPIKSENAFKLSPLTTLILKTQKLPEIVNFIVYLLIILLLIINNYVLNNYKVKINIMTEIMVNIGELLFYRYFSLLLFDYLFMTTNIYLIVNIIFTVIYVYLLILHLSRNNLYYFAINIIKYPYDAFSKIIDLHFLFIKIFISISSMTYKIYISKFVFILSIIILFVLFFYISYIILFKSYFLMNNINLNKLRYSLVLVCCINFIFGLIIDKRAINNYYYLICLFNLFFLCILFICYFYDPYYFAKFGKDDNVENIFYYFFIFDRDKNNYLLLEERLEEHVSRCNKCNLCTKYNKTKSTTTFKNEEIDLFFIISDGKHYINNLFNYLVREIKKNGKKNFNNGSYYLINLIYLYSLSFYKNNINLSLNIELLFDIINSENTQFFEDYKISLKQIQYSNKFFLQANKILSKFDELFNEKNEEKKSRIFLAIGELLNKLKYKEIKSNNNNGNNGNNNIDGIPNCNNLLTICSLFYEELYNESISNSGIYIKDSPNILEDLINNNYKNIKQITLEINISNFETRIIRAGGYLNKYENKNLIDFCPSIFRNRQILQLKKDLFSKSYVTLKYDNKNKKKNKDKKNEKEYINFSFIIEEKENDNIFYRLLKLKLRLIFLSNLNIIIYLNGTYNIDQNIIVTEKKKDKEIVLHFGNQELMNKYISKNNNNIIIKKKGKNSKYLENCKLMEDDECFVECKRYYVYHFAKSAKNKKINNLISTKENLEENNYNYQDEKNNEENNELFLFNDMASQSSSVASSASPNFLIHNSKAIKKIDNNKDITQKFNIVKISLIFMLFLFFIFIIFQMVFLLKYQRLAYNFNNFNLLIMSYTRNFETNFFSAMALICLANSSDSNYCIQYMNEITKLSLLIDKTNEDELSNITNTINTDEDINSFDDGSNNSFASEYFINFTELLIVQNDILINNLNYKLNDLVKYIGEFQENEILYYLNSNISHYKINKNIESNDTNLYLTKKNFTFFEFLLLMTSRFGIIFNDYNNLNKPIYILNKSDEEVFNNIYDKGNLNTYQENVYLLILDYDTFRDYLSIIENSISFISYKLRKKLKNLTYLFININLLILIIIIIILIGYICIYLLIIFKLLNDVNINMKEKIGNVQIRDFFRNKINNLKLLLNFYENDINITLGELNLIYNDYRDNYNLKIKEEAKLIKKEGTNNKNEKKRDEYHCLNLFKIFKKFQLHKYSKRKTKYSYGIIFMFILSLASYISTMVIWILHFKEDTTVSDWVDISSEFITSTNRFMNNFLLMFMKNYTVEDYSLNSEGKNYIIKIYTKLTNLYEGDKYFNSLNDIATLNDKTIKYDCWQFYQTLDNDFFDELREKFKSQENKLFTTMYFFCEWSAVMTFKKYKTIYLQLLNQIKVLMENYTNDTYSNIISFINKHGIIKIEIMFLITYVYLIDVIYTNMETFILTMMKRIKYNIFIQMIIFLATLIIFIIIIFFFYIRNVNKDSKKFINTKKVFKVCNINE